MTSEIEALKTNEFIRRRKLRLQQVREQSKDIAKKIRHRTKVEKLRQVVDLDAKKHKEYLQQQDELVKKLGDLYSRGVENVGASHRSASELNNQDDVQKHDISKQRGRAAAGVLRRKKQEKLDEQKKLLDRKLLAREAANVISREKSAAIANKVNNKTLGDTVPQEEACKDNEKYTDTTEDQNKPATIDMATQWDSGVEPEWEPNVPTLSLPKDDSAKDNVESRSDKSKRLDLFALSEEMPSSLRGGIINTEEKAPIKPSLTLVSEYLQNRALRLREASTSAPSKKPSEDLQSIKDTILRSRTSKPEGTALNACCVLDEQLIPVPSWQAEQHCGFCSHRVTYHNSKKKNFNVTNSQFNQIFSSIRPAQRDSSPVPMFNEAYFRRNRVYERNFKINATEKSSKSSAIDSGATKKNAITIYNHSTRNTRDVLPGDDRLVVRDQPKDDDAYSQARKEISIDKTRHAEHRRKIQEMRHKVAMTKQNVEKEYKDTINFLNSLPKDNGRPIRKAYMDEHRQQMQKDNHELKLQQEYKKIEKECRKHSCTKSRSKSKSPVKIIDNEFDNRDFQYSWMPVPESDGNLAIHTIPTSVKQGKSGNTVKFSKVDSYHEYRSRHRHTPPTKDTSSRDKQANKRVEAVLIDNNTDATDNSSNASESSSYENTRPQKERELSDAERIIIYKILDSKSDKKCKKKEKLMENIIKTLNYMDKKKNIDENKYAKDQHDTTSRGIGNSTFEQLNEGIYKTVSEKGDNIASMSIADKQLTENNIPTNKELGRQQCHCNIKTNEEQHNQTLNAQCSRNDDILRPLHSCIGCNCGCNRPSKTTANIVPQVMQPSTATSTSSFKTATNDKANIASADGGYVKLIDDGGQEAGKFYIGASGLLKDDAYEVVIQLRKKDGLIDKIDDKTTVDEPSGKELNKNSAPVLQRAATEEMANVPDENKNHEPKPTNDIIKEIPPDSTTNKVQSFINTEILLDEPENHSGDVSKDKIVQKHNNPSKVLVDKGVHTSFQMSYAVPSHIPKIDPISRPATSTYTQTTLSSPNHRPMFFHMSSSTSTAYMSPPESVLPQFLRQEYHMSDEDKCDTMNVLNTHGYMSEREYREDYNGCICKKCTHAKKIIINKIKPPACCKKHTKYGNKLVTPPNTARSRSSGDICFHKAAGNKYGASVKSHSHKHKNHCIASEKRHPRNVGVHLSTSTASSIKKNKIRPNVGNTTSRPDINPVLKKYMHKLLALNRDGLKAIEIANQDCSSVNTPGSSIINITNNLDKNISVENKISFEQIKNILKQQIIQESQQDKNYETANCRRRKTPASKTFRRKMVHKVKSLNISKNLQKSKINIKPQCSSGIIASSSSSDKENYLQAGSTDIKSNSRSKFGPSRLLPTPVITPNKYSNAPNDPDVVSVEQYTTQNSGSKTSSGGDKYSNNYSNQKVELPLQRNITMLPCFRSSLATSSSDTDNNFISQNLHRNIDIPVTTSTQTSQNMEVEINLIKLAEDKLQNMEKIADLTEKCTKRLSNLAKVLDEVRKNKSLVYSQISTSDSTSDSDKKSDKNTLLDKNETLTPVVDPIFDLNKPSRSPSPMINTIPKESVEKIVITDSTAFIPFLNDIPKPRASKNTTESTNLHNSSISSKNGSKNIENSFTTSRGRPPPALSRITLKHGHDNIVPHELSTVLEVDSLLSVRLTRDNKGDVSEDSSKTINGSTRNEINKNPGRTQTKKDYDKDPDLLRNNFEVTTRQAKISGTDSSDDSKLQVIDINGFNDIMLKPFITFQEHAKKCNVAFDEASNLEDVANDVVTDDISSLHSDGSLPDVIAELLKRNIISEPFKFDSASNVNSTTVSSESTLSVLALSKITQEKKKQSVLFKNKENIVESSDSLSLSSNPDLEIAFKKLGMGWASSTLKKTKERLALSSSTNTSSSSLSQLKLKSFNQDIPVLVTDSVSSILNMTKKPENRPILKDSSKNAEQQTSLTNSMTVKEFLTNELAKKITFTNKSRRDETGEEFVSLFETKMPEDMKDSKQMHRENNSEESVRSGNNRARTSTPVQIFKSMTYHSSSSSNMSNGLFSNADDLSSVKVTSNSNKNHSTSDKDDLTVPNFSLRMKKSLSDCSKSD